MEIKADIVRDLLDQQSPALSSTSDIPVIETKPDSQAAPSKEETKVETKEVAEQPAESATAATEPEQTGEPAKKESRGVQKALDRLTAERETEKRRADQETETRIRLEERLRIAEERAAPAKPSDDEPVRPSKTDYPEPDAWDAAMLAYADDKAAHTARREVQAFEAKQKQEAEKKSIEDGQRVVRDAYNERVTKAQEKYADFKEVAENPDVQVSMPVVHAIIHSEHGPELQYYLGKNPEEATRISALAPPLQLMELGLILAKIDQPASRPVSAAPAPIKPTKPGTEAAQKDPNDMSMDEYAAHRRSQEKGRGLRH